MTISKGCPESNAPGQPIYLVPEDPWLSGNRSHTIRKFFERARKDALYVLMIVGFSLVGGLLYALTATEWFFAETLLAPADQRLGSGGEGLGGLSALAGVAGFNNTQNKEPLEILKSRAFASKFIRDNNLLTILYDEYWDADNERWVSEYADSPPDIRDAVKLFRENLLTVEEDTQGFLRVGIYWKDPNLAATWLSQLVRELNISVSERELAEAERNVGFLKEQLQQTNLAPLQQSVGSLLEAELHKLMMANSPKEYAYKVIDPPVPPKLRESPKRALVMVIFGFIGGLLAVAFILARLWLFSSEDEKRA